MSYEQPGVLLSDINRAANEIKSTEADNHYEMLDNYNPWQAYKEIKVVQPAKLPDQQGLPGPPSSAGDCDITQCPAYVPIAHGNQQGQQAETSLMQPAPGTTATIDSSEMMSTGSKDQDGNSEDVKDNETYWNVAAF